jgi:hypothetical protein
LRKRVEAERKGNSWRRRERQIARKRELRWKGREITGGGEEDR